MNGKKNYNIYAVNVFATSFKKKNIQKIVSRKPSTLKLRQNCR